MKKAIKQKLLNLVSINPMDYCIKSNTTTKHIDISKYLKKEDFLAFINNEVNKIEISAASGLVAFEEELKKTTNVHEFVEIIKGNNFNITENRIRELTTKFDEAKKKSIVYYVDQMKAFKKTFLSLNRTAFAYYNDTTVWSLYVAYKFLKGKVNSQLAIKAPLILQKVIITEEGSKLFLVKTGDEYFVNEKVQVIMNKEYPGIVSSNEELLQRLSFEENLVRLEKMVGYEIAKDELDLVPFVSEDFKTLGDKYSTLKIDNSALLGIFEPGGSSLKEDLEKIIDLDADPFESQIESNFKPNEYYEEKVIKDSNVIEIGNPLNIYQKYAVLSSLSQSTLIYGPPGTGKSEVIANIICNALIRAKSTLMVSEKKAALDVLTNRINSLSQFALFLCDTHNKENFYKKIDELNHLLGTQWYREPSRLSKSHSLEQIKFNKDEIMFFKNYQEWYSELLVLVKKHWAVEDYNDAIFKMDYSEYQKIRNELGEQICHEWLQQINIDGFGTTTLYEAFKKLYAQFNFSSIDDLFKEYLHFKKFIKKFGLLENPEILDVNKHLKQLNTKIANNISLVEKYLLGGTKLNNMFTNYFLFKEIYNEKKYTNILDVSYKAKLQLFDLVEDYLKFKNRVIDKNFELKDLSNSQKIVNIEIFENFIEKYKKELIKGNWLDFLIENARVVPKFLEKFAMLNSDQQDILFAEFVTNNRIISNLDDCNINFNEIKKIARNMNDVVEIFTAFSENIEVLEKPYMEDLVRFKKLIDFDIDFLEKLYQIKDVFKPIHQEILKEWSWISLPYIKQMYLNPIIIFDLEQTQNIMHHISTPINNDQFEKLKIVAMWSNLIKDIPMFLEIKGIHLQDIIMQLRKESQRAASLVEEITFKKYINNLRSYLTKLSKDEKDEIANMFRIASSKTMPPITQFVKRYYDSLKKVFPIWVARPDNVSDMIPLNQNEFDYGIFDEASQISIERAYPLVYRCKTKVVSGDDKQLKPSSFFMSRMYNNDSFDIDDFDRVESLLERAKVSWWNEYHLKNHYRSESKELIEFSNKFIYNNSLEVATKCNINERGIDVCNVNGVWDQVNKQEANKVVDILVREYENYEKILIITFNSKQSALIENMLFEKRSKFPEDLKEKFDQNNIVVTNLENVQGNEGDLVILSVSYGKNIDGIVKNNFGPLNAKGGSNRLNVAITRAKSKMIVVKSLYGNQIKVSNLNNKNAIIFKKFIEYIDAIQNNKSIDSVEAHIDLSTEDNFFENQNQVDPDSENVSSQTPDGLVFSSDIVREIYSELIKSLNDKYSVYNDVVVGSKNIDLVIKNKATNKVVKAVIIEPWKTNRTIKQMLEDIDRQNFLEDRGYSTFRVKEYEWNIDKTKITSKIKDSLLNQKQNIDYVLWQSEK